MNGKKLKVYLDTSVISHLWQPDSPEKMQETLALWESFKKGNFDIYLSLLTIEEVSSCSETKRNKISEYLQQIEYKVLDVTDEAQNIADMIVDMKILTKKSIDDCTHIGVAISNGLDYLISWNFKHMVNIKTVNGVRAISMLNGYKTIDLVAPTYFLGEEYL